jgi:Flp pilus assembly protein TadD
MRKGTLAAGCLPSSGASTRPLRRIAPHCRDNLLTRSPCAVAPRHCARQCHLEEALADLSHAIGLAPCFARTYADRAQLYRRLGRSREAQEDMQMFAQLSEASPASKPEPSA